MAYTTCKATFNSSCAKANQGGVNINIELERQKFDQFGASNIQTSLEKQKAFSK